MNSSAGLAFSPHVVTIGVGEVVTFFLFISNIDVLTYLVLFLNPECEDVEGQILLVRFCCVSKIIGIGKKNSFNLENLLSVAN